MVLIIIAAAAVKNSVHSHNSYAIVCHILKYVQICIKDCVNCRNHYYVHEKETCFRIGSLFEGKTVFCHWNL